MFNKEYLKTQIQQLVQFQNFNNQIQCLFDESNQANIFSPDFNFYKCLSTIQPNDLLPNETIKCMLNLINAILYLKSNKLNPSQIKFQYFGCDKDKVWGIKYAICYRSIKNYKINNSYDPLEFHYHLNQENQLVWNLGKIWLRFFTNAKVLLIDSQQYKLDSLITKSINDNVIASVVKKMLTIKKQKRISFQHFIQDEVFTFQASPKHLYSSILIHFTQKSKSNVVQNSLNKKRQIKSPFQQQILRRDMSQCLQICLFLDRIIKRIKMIYENSIEIEFAKFIIKAFAFSLLKFYDNKKQINQIQDYNSKERNFYAKYITKMFQLSNQVDRKLKLKIFRDITQKQKKFLIKSDQMTLDHINEGFKEVMLQFYFVADQQISKGQINPLQGEKRALQFLLARTCKKIFTQLRSFVFQEFMINKLKTNPNQKYHTFSIKEFFAFIDECKDVCVVKRIRDRIRKVYFPSTQKQLK